MSSPPSSLLGLTESQRKAVEKTSDPCVILAGPGTGKTSTVVSKVRYLIETGVCKPSEILCLTFSNETTNAIKMKILEKLQGASEVMVSTFHSFCASILREEGIFIEIDPGFEILEPDDSKVMFHRDLKISPYYADRYATTIATVKDFGIKLEQIQEYLDGIRRELALRCPDIDHVDDFAKDLDLELNTLHLQPQSTVEQRRAIKSRKKEINEFNDVYEQYRKYRDFLNSWESYNKLKKEKNYQDFADLVTNTLTLFNKHGSATYAKRYKYVIIDEFQDTNQPQLEIIEAIAGQHRNLTVVGDQDQSIYGFRGARREVFRIFKERFGINDETDIIKLDKSFRCPNSMLNVAHDLILNNNDEAITLENAVGNRGENVKIIRMKSGEEEARKVAEIVEGELSSGVSPQEICVLFRTWRQGELLRQAFESRQIPLATAGQTDLLQTPEIRTVIAFLSILNNLRERTGTGEQAWWSLFHYRNALTPEDSVKIGRYLRQCQDTAIDEALLTAINEIGLSPHGRQVVERIVGKIRELVAASDKSLSELIMDIYEISGLNRRYTHKRTVRNVEAMTNLKFFYDLAERYWTRHSKSLSGFVKYIEIIDDLKIDIPASRVADIDAVRFMTIHSVKGLEFTTVIISNLAENRFPIERTRNEPLIPKRLLPDIGEHLEQQDQMSPEEEKEAIKEWEREVLLREERRLFYVGMTRAKKKLILTYATSYNEEENSAAPSIFLNEIGFESWSAPKSSGFLDFEIDDEEKAIMIAPTSMFEQYRARLKNQLIDSLDSEDFPTVLARLIAYNTVKQGKVPDYHDLIEGNWERIYDHDMLTKLIDIEKAKASCLRFDPEIQSFSPTGLLVYEECPKKYELQNVLRMPQRGDFEFDAASAGSFIHEVVSQGVKLGFSSEKEFLDLAVKLYKEAEWTGIDIDDVTPLLKVFWLRNQGKYNSHSVCEMPLSAKLDGFAFRGRADRVDYLPDTKVRIVDYKTNSRPLPPLERAWQLGFYAIAVKESLGLEPTELVLDMLRLEKPFEGRTNGSVVESGGRSEGFDLNQVRQQLVETARKISFDFEHEFLPSADDLPCRNCGYKFYCPKWEEN